MHMAKYGQVFACMCMAYLFGQGLHAAQAQHTIRSCKPSDLSVHFDDGQGEFNGMSHSGAWIVLFNHSASRCTMPAVPQILLEDAQAHVLATGKPVQPLPDQRLRQTILRPHVQWRASMYWVSGDVYDGGHCVTPMRAVLKFPVGDLGVDFPQRTLCGPSSGDILFEQGQLQQMPR